MARLDLIKPKGGRSGEMGNDDGFGFDVEVDADEARVTATAGGAADEVTATGFSATVG